MKTKLELGELDYDSLTISLLKIMFNRHDLYFRCGDNLKKIESFQEFWEVMYAGVQIFKGVETQLTLHEEIESLGINVSYNRRDKTIVFHGDVFSIEEKYIIEIADILKRHGKNKINEDS